MLIAVRFFAGPAASTVDAASVDASGAATFVGAFYVSATTLNDDLPRLLLNCCPLLYLTDPEMPVSMEVLEGIVFEFFAPPPLSGLLFRCYSDECFRS